jgi:hypothetical protein
MAHKPTTSPCLTTDRARANATLLLSKLVRAKDRARIALPSTRAASFIDFMFQLCVSLQFLSCTAAIEALA